MTAGRADGVAGRDHPGTVDPAGLDRLAEVDVEHVAAGLDEEPQVADGREPSPQRPLPVGDGAQAPS